jgi:hypothetical protein
MRALAKRAATVAEYILALLLRVMLILVFLLINNHWEDRMFVGYGQILVGMDLAGVQQILGQGMPISADEVPQFPSGPFVEERLRISPVVKGETYCKWEDNYGRKIVIAFVENRVRQKWYWEPDL